MGYLTRGNSDASYSSIRLVLDDRVERGRLERQHDDEGLAVMRSVHLNLVWVVTCLILSAATIDD